MRINPRVVVTVGSEMVRQMPGARLMVQTVMAIVRIARMSMSGIEWKTSHAYQRSTMPSVTGIGVGNPARNGAAAQGSDQHEHGKNRDFDNGRAHGTEESPNSVDQRFERVVAEAAFLDCGLRHQGILGEDSMPAVLTQIVGSHGVQGTTAAIRAKNCW